jgi:hypothetical protein
VERRDEEDNRKREEQFQFPLELLRTVVSFTTEAMKRYKKKKMERTWKHTHKRKEREKSL